MLEKQRISSCLVLKQTPMQKLTNKLIIKNYTMLQSLSTVFITADH